MKGKTREIGLGFLRSICQWSRLQKEGWICPEFREFCVMFCAAYMGGTPMPRGAFFAMR
jgi:hypothetical protein